MIEELKNDNTLLKEENNYLKRKLFGTKSEINHSLGFDQLSFFDEAYFCHIFKKRVGITPKQYLKNKKL